MKANCHQCGREYLAARGLAGQAVRCRSCGATNDGAGGSPPAQPERPRGASNQLGRPPIASGSTFRVGEDLKAPPPLPMPLYPPPGQVAPRPHAYRRANRAMVAVSCGLLMLALMGGIAMWILQRARSVPRDSLASIQMAVPQVVGAGGTGSGWITEVDGKLWVVTNYHVLEGNQQVDLLFRDPTTGRGEVLFRLPALNAMDFRVHADFLRTKDLAEDGREFDLVAVSVEDYRPQMEKYGISPLSIAVPERIRSGIRVSALGHPGSRAFDNAEEADAAAANIAVHSVFDGVVSNLRRKAGEPTIIQTTADFKGGCSGGPLVLDDTGEVVGVNTWNEVAEDGGERSSMNYALAAEHVTEVIRDGSVLSDIRRLLVGRADRPAETDVAAEGASEYPEQSWVTFDSLDGVFRALADEGWQFKFSHIAVSEGGGTYQGEFAVSGPGDVELAILVLPEERGIDIDVSKISVEGFSGVGEAVGSVSGAVDGTILRHPRTGESLQVPAGAKITLDISTFFLGTGIPARFVAVVLERPVEAAGAEPAAGATGAMPAGPHGPPWSQGVPTEGRRLAFVESP